MIPAHKQVAYALGLVGGAFLCSGAVQIVHQFRHPSQPTHTVFSLAAWLSRRALVSSSSAGSLSLSPSSAAGMAALARATAAATAGAAAATSSSPSSSSSSSPPAVAAAEGQATPPTPYRIVIKNPEGVRAKLEKLKRDGPSRLQVISDFDMTLTQFTVNGKRGMSSHGIIEHSHMLDEQYHIETSRLFQKYYPVEVDSTLTPAEKVPLMVEWWEMAHEQLIKYRMNKAYIPEMVAKANIGFRDGCVAMFDKLHKADVPVLIFSAGIGDVIKETLRTKARLHKNMHVISNFMRFDEQGYTVGFVGKTIHVYNKQDVVIKGSAFHESIEDRHNVILLGDSIGDLQMSHGIEKDTQLAIGFLNDKIEQRLEEHSSKFDIVIVGDGPMDYVNQIVDRIILSAPGSSSSAEIEGLLAASM